MDWLARSGVGHEAPDLFADGQAHQEMDRPSGQARAPVIEVDGRVLADCGVGELAPWRKRQGIEPS